MSGKPLYRSALARLTAVVLWLGLAVPASAVNVVVGGVTYDVQFFNGQSFDANVGVLTDTNTAPWWGNDTLSRQFRDAYAALGAPYAFNVTGSPDSLNFAWGLFGTTVVYNRVTDTGTTSNGSTVTNTTASSSHHFAYVVAAPPPAPGGAVAVPEIDGNALPKALFVLFTLGLWLHTRRARKAISDHT